MAYETAEEIIAKNVAARMKKYDKETQEMLDSYNDDPYTKQWIMDCLDKPE